MDDEDDAEYDVIYITPDAMREPTNLELAQLISMQGQMYYACSMLQAVSSDILSEDEDVLAAAQDAQASADMVEKWWLKLLKDGVDTDPEE